MFKPRRSRARRRILLATLLVALGLIGWGATAAWGAAQELRAARADIDTAEASARDLEFDDARAALRSADDHLRRARGSLGAVPLRVAARIPYLGRSVRAVDLLTDAAAIAVDGADTALDASTLLPDPERFTFEGGRLPQVDWRRFASLSERAAGSFGDAAAIARRAPASLVPGLILDARTQILDAIADAQRTAERLASGARILPGMLGENGPTRHLIVVQNGAEARATGGAIEAVMLLQARERQLDLIRSDPDELALGTASDRDRGHRLNLDPDFPASAARIARIYREVTGVRPDTVIATDSHGLAAILRVTGGIRVDGNRLTGDNLVGFLSRDIFVRYPTELGQGLVLASTSRAMWDRLRQGQIPVRRMVGQLGGAARAKHFLLWSADLDEQRAFTHLGVSGALPPPPPPRGGALVAVVGNNSGLAELDFYARRSWRYGITVEPDGSAREQLTVELTNSARLRDIPPAVLRKQPRGVLIHDVTIRAGGIEERARMQARPGTTAELTVTGTFQSTPGELRLIVFRQPSLRPDDVRIEIELPDGLSVIEAPPEAQVDGRRVVWTGRPTADVELLVRYR